MNEIAKVSTFLSENAVRYAFSQVIERIGLDSSLGFDALLELGISVSYGTNVSSIICDKNIIITQAESDCWTNLLYSSVRNIEWIDPKQALPSNNFKLITSALPVLFWGAEYNEGCYFAELIDDFTLIFNADILSAVFFMLSRWEENTLDAHDDHGRFMATASLAYQNNFLDRPIVDEMALIFAAWIQVLCPQWVHKPKKFSVHISHDIDHIYRARGAKEFARALSADVIKYRSLSQAKRTLLSAWQPESDEYFFRLKYLADLSTQYNFQSEFYFMAADQGGYDSGYDPNDSRLVNCYSYLRKSGHTIGLHPSYYTLGNPDKLAEEKHKLELACGANVVTGRQHYLRFRVPDTWHHWDAVGMKIDSSMGYADIEGFRCGTCHPYQVFDINQDLQLSLIELPLIVMEGTLLDYRKLSPEVGLQRILDLAKTVQRVGGTFSILWHNTSFWGQWRAWTNVYESMIHHLHELS